MKRLSKVACRLASAVCYIFSGVMITLLAQSGSWTQPSGFAYGSLAIMAVVAAVSYHSIGDQIARQLATQPATN